VYVPETSPAEVEVRLRVTGRADDAVRPLTLVSSLQKNCYASSEAVVGQAFGPTAGTERNAVGATRMAVTVINRATTSDNGGQLFTIPR
jgi:hypothetical protein